MSELNPLNFQFILTRIFPGEFFKSCNFFFKKNIFASSCGCFMQFLA